MHAVTAGPGSDQNNGITYACRFAKFYFIHFQQAYAHGINQRVALITRVKANFTGNSRNADAIAITGYPCNYTFQKIARAAIIKWTKTQGIKQGNGPGTHGKDITDNPAYSCGSTLIGFNS